MLKIFLREKFIKAIGLRFSDYGSEMVENRCAKKNLLLGLCHSLWMDLGQDHQQHPTVNSGGVSWGRVRGCGCWH